MTCTDETYREFCIKTIKYTPCCKEIKLLRPISVFPLSGTPDETPMFHPFELEKILININTAKYRVHGLSMFPYIKPGETVHIRSKPIDKIQAGDIAVYKDTSRILAHRVVKKGQDEKGRKYIITRPEYGEIRDEGPYYEEDLLGIVSKIERKGRVVVPAETANEFYSPLFFKAKINLFKLKRFLSGKFIFFIAFIQQFTLYKKVAEYLSQSLNNKIELFAHVPLNEKLSDYLYRKISCEEFVSEYSDVDKEIPPKWDIAAYISGEKAAVIAFTFKPTDCPYHGWWVSGIRVRIRYRRTALEKTLIKEAGSILTSLGIETVSVAPIEKANLDIKFFKSADFNVIDTFEDKNIKHRNDSFLSRVVMKKTSTL